LWYCLFQPYCRRLFDSVTLKSTPPVGWNLTSLSFVVEGDLHHDPVKLAFNGTVFYCFSDTFLFHRHSIFNRLREFFCCRNDFWFFCVLLKVFLASLCCAGADLATLSKHSQSLPCLCSNGSSPTVFDQSASVTMQAFFVVV
jgi:hypothetical protein